jgi:hypothetical protein
MTMGITINQNQIDQVLTALQQQGKRCPVEEVVELCSDLTGDQVFLAIDYVTRTGLVCQTLDANRTSWIRANTQGVVGDQSSCALMHGL